MRYSSIYDGFYGTGGVVEAQIGIVSGTNSIRKGRYAQAKRSLLDKRSVSASVTLNYDGSILSVIVNGTTVLSYTVKNFDIQEFYMVPFSGTAIASNLIIGCESINLTFDNNGLYKPYDTNNPIILPCDTPAFSVSFDLTSDSDFFVAFAQSDGFYGTGGVVEAQIGIVSGTNSIRKGRYAQAKRSLLDKRSVSASVTLNYDGSILSVIVNGTTVLSYTVKNFDIQEFYMVPFSGTAIASNLIIGCESISKCTELIPI
ncbi:hypothetical protein BB559_001042 [Furculomyces boomerangus]|uniref:Uncharacterized protein n=1 Tax=Furculomyces boomerangus TaxID=61424 RepID=A0A2T9Z389_9FUNG|nr:hypothetical protein BB559_001042 [Furculomyces boomerangus]